MKIIKTSRALSPMEIYKFTKNPESLKASDHIGERFVLTGVLIYEDTNVEDGSTKIITMMEDEDGNYIGSNSPTIARSMSEILEIYEDAGVEAFPLEIEIITGKSRKSGRNYVDIVLRGEGDK